jgi:NADH-quinone oxidoreductase subunit C
MSSAAPLALKSAWHGMIASNDRLSALDGHVQGLLGDAVLDTAIAHGELTVTVKRDAIVQVLTMLRDDAAFPFKSLMDMSGADYPERPERFDVVYHLLCYVKNIRLRVRVMTDDVVPVASAVGVFESANWNEREIWDLFGVAFAGHPDMRRLLTDYGFTGHPLRKDFPLTGYVELRYSEEDKRVIYEPVKLTQDFRSFDFLSPWEGAHYVLPGDEKAGEKK